MLDNDAVTIPVSVPLYTRSKFTIETLVSASNTKLQLRSNGIVGGGYNGGGGNDGNDGGINGGDGDSDLVNGGEVGGKFGGKKHLVNMDQVAA